MNLILNLDLKASFQCSKELADIALNSTLNLLNPHRKWERSLDFNNSKRRALPLNSNWQLCNWIHSLIWAIVLQMDKLKISILSTTEPRITNNTGFAREGRAFRCPWLGQKNIKSIFSRSSIPQYLTTIRVFLCCLSISRLPLICLRIGGRTKIKTQRYSTFQGEQTNLLKFDLQPVSEGRSSSPTGVPMSSFQGGSQTAA